MEINKSVRVGTVKIGKHIAPIYCDIEYIEGKLSISGVIGPRPNGDAWGEAGQIDMSFDPLGVYKPFADAEAQEVTFAEGWNAEKWAKFLGIWNHWHLNNMRAGCIHQEKRKQSGESIELSEPCPKCGYKYGHLWLFEAVPDEVKEFLNDLPEAWIPNPWKH